MAVGDGVAAEAEAPLRRVWAWRQDVAGSACFVLLWTAYVCHQLGSAPPAVTWFEVPAGLALLASLGLGVHGVAKGWLAPWTRRWGLTAVALSAPALLATSRCFFTGAGGWSPALTVVLTVPVMLGLLVAALVRVGRHFVESTLVSLIVVGFTVLLVSGAPHPIPALRARLRTVGFEAYERAGRRELDRPGEHGRLAKGVPFVAGRGDRLAVGWALLDGIPAKAEGLVYDPRHALDRGARLDGLRSDYAIEPDRCDRIDGPWYWCRVY